MTCIASKYWLIFGTSRPLSILYVDAENAAVTSKPFE